MICIKDFDMRMRYYRDNYTDNKLPNNIYYSDMSQKLNDGLNIHLSGAKVWMKDEKHHRVYGPAVTHVDGTFYWWLDNDLHREDGPATKNNDWYYHGKRLNCDNLKDYNRLKKLVVLA